LQDCISIAHIDPTLCRKQILLHAQHQFVEGDVQHWWHEPSGKGTRTRISDDRLWLPYATAEYIRITEDWDVLREDLPYLESPPLKDQEEERYEKPSVAEESSSLYEHCIRAIEISLRFGSHGLPLMGTGDWNDGMNAVGIKGKGESVWLGWFLYSVLNLFIPLCQKLGDEERASRYRGVMKRVLESIEKNGWDGNWYRRAFFDNGTVLGSIVNTECKIDSIAQSWAVISGGADPIRASRAMQSVEDHLILRENGIITLLYPPFDQGETEPGYIKSYLPGVRENGGQYTHAAAWVMIAFAKMGQGNKAWELFSMLNPIHHTNNLKEYSTYKTEPYVVAADVYSQPPNTGRGGWTWYTGSASWLYRAGLEYLLGFQKHGDEIRMEPCIPTTWEEFSIKYQYHDTLYHITVLNPEHLEKGVKLITMDGLPLKGNCIPLFDDHIDHNVKVFLGSLQNQEL
jgi:cellobiose phosphorylase